MKIKDLFSDRIFLRKVLGIALPVAFNSLLNMLVNFADTVMIGRLGEKALASVGLGNRVFFIFILLVFGISSGATVLTAQYWGKKDVESIQKILGMALLPGIVIGILFTLAALHRPALLMAVFTEDAGTIALGSSYLRIVGLSYTFVAITSLYNTTIRNLGSPILPVITTGLAMALNVTLNYILIFGHLGFPAMGVQGAAYATLVTRISEMIFVLCLLYLRKSPVACSPLKLFRWNRSLFYQFIQNALPVIGNEFMWGLGTAMYSAAYGRMGDMAFAAITITFGLQDIMVVGFMGIATATAVLLGNEMGAGHLETAKRYAKHSFVLVVIVGIFVALLTLLIRDPFISLYRPSEELARQVRNCLLVYALYDVLKAFNTVNIVGVLRSGGDTRYCFFLDVSGVWFIGIPMAFLGGLVWKLPIYYVLALVLLEEIYKWVLGIRRYRKGLWINNLTIGENG